MAKWKSEIFEMTCKRCKIRMLELKGHIYHGKRKFRCPVCGRHSMQKTKELERPNKKNVD